MCFIQLLLMSFLWQQVFAWTKPERKQIKVVILRKRKRSQEFEHFESIRVNDSAQDLHIKCERAF